jgi:hypothetical protein
MKESLGPSALKFFPYHPLRGSGALRAKGFLPPAAAGCRAVAPACSGLDFPASPFSTVPLASPAAATNTAAPTGTPTPPPTRTPSPTLIPGIEEPVQLGGAQLLITKALRRDVLRCGDSNKPTVDQDPNEFLLLILQVIKGPSVRITQFEDWMRDNRIDRIVLRYKTPDGQGRVKDFRDSCYSYDPDTYILIEIILGFVIERSASDFEVGLPNGTTIPLDSIMPQSLSAGGYLTPSLRQSPRRFLYDGSIGRPMPKTEVFPVVDHTFGR